MNYTTDKFGLAYGIDLYDDWYSFGYSGILKSYFKGSNLYCSNLS